MLNFIKNDYMRVYWMLKLLSDGKIPNWVIFLYYIVLAPIGFALLPFVMLYNWYLIRKLTK